MNRNLFRGMWWMNAKNFDRERKSVSSQLNEERKSDWRNSIASSPFKLLERPSLSTHSKKTWIHKELRWLLARRLSIRFTPRGIEFERNEYEREARCGFWLETILSRENKETEMKKGKEKKKKKKKAVRIPSFLEVLLFSSSLTSPHQKKKKEKKIYSLQ